MNCEISYEVIDEKIIRIILLDAPFSTSLHPIYGSLFLVFQLLHRLETKQVD
mgnify:CR=1 FL=1